MFLNRSNSARFKFAFAISLKSGGLVYIRSYLECHVGFQDRQPGSELIEMDVMDVAITQAAMHALYADAPCRLDVIVAKAN